MKKDLLKLLDLTSEDILEILDTADQLKAMKKASEITEDDLKNGETKIQRQPKRQRQQNPPPQDGTDTEENNAKYPLAFASGCFHHLSDINL